MAKRRQPDEAAQRRQANREIGQAYRTITAIKTLYFCTAGLAGVVLIGALLAGAATAAVICAAAAALLLVGASQVMKRPGEWSVVIALVISLLVGILVFTAKRASTHNIWGVAVAICLWAVVPLAFRVRGLLAKHDDLYIAEKWKGTRAAPKETERSRRIAAETERQKQRKQLMLLIGIGAFIVFAFALTKLPDWLPDDEGPVAEEPPPRPEFGQRAVRFRTAWNDKTWEDVAAFIAPRDRPRRSARLARILKKRGWFEKRPRLGSPSLEEDSRGRMIAMFPLEENEFDELIVRWEAGETQWWWTGSKWPKRD